MYKIIVIALILGLAVADHIDKDAETKSLVSDIREDGSYDFSFETSNGISRKETGSGGENAVIQGSANWVAPDGTPVQLSFVADENGYQPKGDAIPEVPAYVLRAIEYIKAHPYVEDAPKGRRP